MEVLEERVAQEVVVLRHLDDRRDGVLAGLTGGPPPPLPHDELVARLAVGSSLRDPADDDGLQDADLPDGVRQLGELVVVEDPSRLARVGPDVVEGDLGELGSGHRSKSAGVGLLGLRHGGTGCTRCGESRRAVPAVGTVGRHRWAAVPGSGRGRDPVGSGSSLLPVPEEDVDRSLGSACTTRNEGTQATAQRPTLLGHAVSSMTGGSAPRSASSTAASRYERAPLLLAS